MNKPEYFDDTIRSAEVQQIINKVPSWIVRSGMSIIFAVVALLFSIAAVVKVPVYISGTIEQARLAGNTLHGRLELAAAGDLSLRPGQQVIMKYAGTNRRFDTALQGSLTSIKSREVVIAIPYERISRRFCKANTHG